MSHDGVELFWLGTYEDHNEFKERVDEFIRSHKNTQVSLSTCKGSLVVAILYSYDVPAAPPQ